jgi:hypothetical protein
MAVSPARLPFLSPLGVAAVLALAWAMPAARAAAQGPRPFTVAESGRAYARLADAVRAIGAGQGTIRIAPGRYRDCAVQEAGRILYVAERRGAAVFDGGICEGKATLVLRGRSARIDGLAFTHERVAEGNGAGIRIEQGDLIVSYATFTDAQGGILSAIDPSSTIAIDHSTFSGLGKRPDGDGAHAVYVGGYGGLSVARSRFERGTGGHYVKSRAARIEIVDSSFDDSAGKGTDYMIDLPNGAVGRIAGNSFIQGRDKENFSTMIAVTAEGRVNPSAGLTVEDNQASLAPGVRRGTTFVGDWSGEPLTIRANRLGKGIRPFGRR